MNLAQPQYGPFCKTNDPMLIEAAARAGFNFVILDAEHGPQSPRELYPLILAAEANAITPIVRVGSLSAVDIQRALDLGAAGVQIPQIETEEDARNAVAFSKFHPIGRRGVCRYVRPADYSLKDKAKYFADQNRDVAVIIHIEGARGVANIDEIIAVPGIDVLFLGPYDLSQSLGVPGEVHHPKVQEAIASVVARSTRAGKNVGIFVETPEAAKRYAALGVHYIAYSVDLGIFAEACRAITGALGISR